MSEKRDIHTVHGWVTWEEHQRMIREQFEQEKREARESTPNVEEIEKRADDAWMYADDDAMPIARDVWALVAEIKRLRSNSKSTP